MGTLCTLGTGRLTRTLWMGITLTAPHLRQSVCPTALPRRTPKLTAPALFLALRLMLATLK